MTHEQQVPVGMHDAIRRHLISIVLPVFNEEANVERAYERISKQFEAIDRYDIELIFTDNHSADKTFELLQALAKKDGRVKVLRFTRNFGFQRSLMMAYRFARGSAAIQIDCDLQDPPELMLEFLTLWEAGHDVVVGIRRQRKEAALLSWSRRRFYGFLNYISDEPLTPNAGDFRLVSRSVLQQLVTLNDSQPYIRGIISSLACNETGILYDREERAYGKSKFPVRKLVRFALDGIIGHSVVPLRVATYVGLATSFVTFLLSLYYFIGALVFGASWPTGFATITVLLLLGISLNAVFLGIIGEYLSRIYQQVRPRPLVVIEKAINIEEAIR